MLKIRRTVLTKHGRPPVAGSIELLAPHYKEGMEEIYKDMRKVMRLLEPEPIAVHLLGDSDTAEECMYLGMHA